MNTRHKMIIIKDKIRTSEIKAYFFNRSTQKWDVEFHNGKTYSYKKENLQELTDPEYVEADHYHIARNGREFSNIEKIYVFKGKNESYWHICFANGKESDYLQSELDIMESVLNQKRSSEVFEYIKQVAKLCNIRNEDTGEKLLPKKFDSISFIGNDVALSGYLNPSAYKKTKTGKEYIPIFPFGCNNSQYNAVKSAMENQFSVIQGPPGTGKTQTILNIIANILLQGKTVQIVSNNNSATDNVYEKLSSKKYGFGFVVAALGNSGNKKAFIENQNGKYPNFSTWRIKENRAVLLKSIKELSVELKDIFDRQEKLAGLRQELSQLSTEREHFNRYMKDSGFDLKNINYKKKMSSGDWMRLWQRCQMHIEREKKLGFLFKIKIRLGYGRAIRKLFDQNLSKLIITFQTMYYYTKKEELTEEVKKIENSLKNVDNILGSLCDRSMQILRDSLAGKYKNNNRRIFCEDDLWKVSKEFLKEYPVVLSTTFSARSSLNSNEVYDYLIMDEASQVDIATGALALSCAKNVVIVGDTKQLPNVVTEEIKNEAKEIFKSFNIDKGYYYTKSFLQSILEVMPDVTQTMLREHYRCHPKIIGFCNQKFYRGELRIMTKDNGEDDVLSVMKTVQGNHARGHYSQRQIDVIRNEILPQYIMEKNETGIISPYKNQIKALEKEIKGIDIATVHKFQGKEKDNIIISTVDDELSDFVDDPYLINVAVSRAKKRLVLVVTGNQQTRERNIVDLINYIQYHNFEVADSNVNSVFDYLYIQYAEERSAYLKKHKKISEYDSENLMYVLINEIIADNKYASLNVICHFPLNMLIKDSKLLNEREREYMSNPATHLDFLIYNRIGKTPMLAIEVDGYNYHKENTAQGKRDLLKNHILELYEIPMLRFKTNGSNEKERIMGMLDTLMK